MKKIYLEKQLMKALGNTSGYLIGNLIPQKGKYIFKKENGKEITLMPQAILAWEDFNRENKTFTVEQLEKIKTKYYDPFIKVDKVIYCVDSVRTEEGKHVYCLMKAEINNVDVVTIKYIVPLKNCRHVDFAKEVLHQINEQYKEEVNAELRIDVTGLGGLLSDYLEECPIPIKKYKGSMRSEMTSALVKHVEEAKFKIQDKRVIQALDNLDLHYLPNKGTPILKRFERDDIGATIINCLMMSCYEPTN